VTEATEQPVMGFKDMHPAQTEALLTYINMTLSVTPDEYFQEILDAAEDLVVILGGVGIEVQYGVDF
jgi:hypothetical protein